METRYSLCWVIFSFSDSKFILDLPGGANVLAPILDDLQGADILQYFTLKMGYFTYPMIGPYCPIMLGKSCLEIQANYFKGKGLFVRSSKTTNRQFSGRSLYYCPVVTSCVFWRKSILRGKTLILWANTVNPGQEFFVSVLGPNPGIFESLSGFKYSIVQSTNSQVFSVHYQC